MDMGENSGVMILQAVVIILAVIILVILFMDQSKSEKLQEAISAFKCPELPNIPECPDCSCDSEGCPDCICDTATPLNCPECPACPEHSMPSVDEIVNAIFPGRNQGMTTHGNYFPLDGLGEANVEPAYSPVINMMPNYTSGTGTPSAISFADQNLLSGDSSIGLASQRMGPISTTQGVFSDPNASDETPDETPASPPVSPPVSDEEMDADADATVADATLADTMVAEAPTVTAEGYRNYRRIRRR